MTAEIITDADPDKSRLIIKGMIIGFETPTRGSLIIEKANLCSGIRTIHNPFADTPGPEGISAMSDGKGVMNVNMVKTFAELKQQPDFAEFTDITAFWDRSLVLSIEGRGRVGCWALRGLSPRPENEDEFANKLGDRE